MHLNLWSCLWSTHYYCDYYMWHIMSKMNIVHGIFWAYY